MNAMALMFQPLWKYAIFSGRARRMEYWLFVLFYFVGNIVATVVDALFGLSLNREHEIGFVRPIWDVAMLLPLLAVAVPRLHDTDRSGWWILLIFVPIFGWIVLIVFYCLRGDAGTNRFGPDPPLLRA